MWAWLIQLGVSVLSFGLHILRCWCRLMVISLMLRLHLTLDSEGLLLTAHY